MAAQPNPNPAPTRAEKQLTAVEALTKINRVLDQLTPADRGDVVDFINKQESRR